MKCSYLVLWLSAFWISCQSFPKKIDVHRADYKQKFLHDPRSPLQEDDLNKLDFYAPDKNARVEANFQLTPQAEPFELPTYSGITRTYRLWGQASFKFQNQPITVHIFENMTLKGNPLYNDYLFFPFKDETNGLTTYGGGRYLNLSKSDAADGKITIDFNKSYNPWCAYSDGYNCPIPPIENHIPLSIEAGEKNYTGAYKKVP